MLICLHDPWPLPFFASCALFRLWQELENLHKLEVVQLENFLDAQVAAGKAVPLKDEGAFRRRREQLYSTQF